MRREGFELTTYGLKDVRFIITLALHCTTVDIVIIST